MVLVIGGLVAALLGLSDIVFAEQLMRWHNKPRDRRGWRVLVKPIPVGSLRENRRWGAVELIGGIALILVALARA